MNLYSHIKGSDVCRRMLQGLFWTCSGTAIAKFITLIAGILCAHILTKEEFGEFGIIKSTINMLVVFGTSGLGVTATRYISEHKKHNQKTIFQVYKFTNYLGLFTGLICCFLTFLLANNIATYLLHQPSLTSSLQIGCILLFLSIINGIQNGVLTGFEDFKAIAISAFIGSIFETLLMLLGAYYYATNGAILGFGIGFLAMIITNKLYIQKHINQKEIKYFKFKELWNHDFWLLLRFSLPATLSSIMIAPTFWIIRSMLVRSDGFKELAIFEAADQWKIAILFIPTAVSQIALPLFSSMQKEKTKFQKTLYLNISIVTFTSVVLTLTIFGGSKYIMGLYGNSYDNYTCIKILACSTIFSSIANILEMSIYSKDKMWQCFIINLLWSISLIGFTKYFLLHGMGADGLALSVGLSYSLSCVIYAFYYHRISKES